MIYKGKLPEGYYLVLLGDGYSSVLKAVVKSIKYPDRVMLIGRIPRKSWMYILSDFKRIVIPQDTDIQASTLLALHDSLDTTCQSVPLLIALDDKYKQVIRLNAKKIEDSFIIADED